MADDLPTRAVALTDDQKFQAALARFQDHVEILRALTGIDLQIFGGYLTLQLGLAAWLAENPPSLWPARSGIFLIDATLSALAVKLLYNNYRRRMEVVASLTNVRAYLGFARSGEYLQGSALDAPTTFRPWWWWYVIGISVTLAGVAIVLFAGSESVAHPCH